MQSGARHLQALLAAMGEPSRFEIVLELARRERHVSDLARTVGLSQSCTTRHLQALERAGLVRTRRAGKRVMAALAAEGGSAAGLLAWLDRELGTGSTDVPGRTGGKDARREVPQDAPPRQESRARAAPESRADSAAPRGGRRSRPAEPAGSAKPQALPRPPRRAVAPAPPAASAPPQAGAQDESHAPAPASAKHSPPAPEPPPRPADDLEDFLL